MRLLISENEVPSIFNFFINKQNNGMDTNDYFDISKSLVRSSSASYIPSNWEILKTFFDKGSSHHEKSVLKFI